MSGKGSAPRPFSVDAQTFAHNWAQTFGQGMPELTKAEKDAEGTDARAGEAEGIA